MKSRCEKILLKIFGVSWVSLKFSGGFDIGWKVFGNFFASLKLLFFVYFEY